MTKSYLFEAARNLPPVSAESARNYAGNQAGLATAVSQILLQREDLERLIGPGNQPMMEDNHRNHARFIASLLESFDPQVLVETVLWVFRAYRNHGFNPTYWPAQLDAWLKVLQQLLPRTTFQELEPLYRFMLFHQSAFARLSGSAASSPASSPPGEEHYLDQQPFGVFHV